MSRPRTAVLELRGSFKQHPKRGRERENEPKPQNPIGLPPSSLKEDEKAAWKEMAAEGFWLTSADRFMLEIAAGLIVQHRKGIIENPARSLLISTLSKLGFGPTDRSKLKVPETPKVSGSEKFKR